MKRKNPIYLKMINWPALLVLAAYIIFISYRLFFFAYSDNIRYTMKELSYNFVPFKTISNFIINRQSIKFDVLIYNLAGNIAAFMPLGFLLPAAFAKLQRIKYTLLAAFILIFTAEVAQLVTNRGVFDIDDIILNIIGAAIGYSIYKIVRKMVSL